MIIPDINLLIYAYDSDSPQHSKAREWWEATLSDAAPVALPWIVIIGFIRLATHPRVFRSPLPVDRACAHAESWLEQPQVFVLHAGERHEFLLFQLLRELGTGGNLTTDAHLAALAIEHQAELNSTDSDFARFPGLRWVNPLAG